MEIIKKINNSWTVMKRLPTIRNTPSEEIMKTDAKQIIEGLDEHQILNPNTVIDEIYEESKRNVDRNIFKVNRYSLRNINFHN